MGNTILTTLIFLISHFTGNRRYCSFIFNLNPLLEINTFAIIGIDSNYQHEKI